MKRLFSTLLAIMCFAAGNQAATTIDSNTTSNSAWGANIGWINCYADSTNGAVIGEYFCSGNLYSANCGWINLGNGAPANGSQYQNNSATDFGINHDAAGNLRGYAYGANIGWINFEVNGSPKINLQTGVMSGYVWGANVGWISLSNAFAVVKTTRIDAAPDTDGDGIPDAWEKMRASDLTTLSGGSHDADGDGVSDYNEYLADTNPKNTNSVFKITAYSMFFSGVNDIHSVTWNSSPTRVYRFITTSDLNYGPQPIGGFFSPDPGSTTTSGIGFGGYSPTRFLGIEVARPLAP